MTAETLTWTPDATLGDPILDNPTWAGLVGHHQRFAQRQGLAARYLSEVSPFVALADTADPQAWQDAAKLLKPGEVFALSGTDVVPPPGWETAWVGDGVQLVDVSLAKAADPQALDLGIADVPEMLDLVARTNPGPFRSRTVELGGYLGYRHQGKLIAMAGRRLHPDGWTEISAVCTDPDFRGRGLAAKLVSAVAAGIEADGDRVFLHAAATNVNAIRLYEAIGFQLRLVTRFYSITVPHDGRRFE